MQVLTEKNFLLLDTCILEYWLHGEIRLHIEELVSQWSEKDQQLVISDISYAELIRGAHKKKTNEVKALLKAFTNLEVTQRVLAGSGILSSIYHAQDKQTNGAEIEDLILAATAYIYQSPIVTANVRHFPYPFFTQKASKNVIYRKEKTDHMISIALLVPDNKSAMYWYAQLP